MFQSQKPVIKPTLGLIIAIAVVSACGKGSSPQATQLSQVLGDLPAAGGTKCQIKTDSLYNEAYRQVDQYGTLPSAESVRSELEATSPDGQPNEIRRGLASVYSDIASQVENAAESGRDPNEGAHESDGVEATDTITAAISESGAGSVASATPASAETERFTRLKRLAQLELGDRSTEAKARAQDALENKLAHINELIASGNPDCGQPSMTPNLGNVNPVASPTPTGSITHVNPAPTPGLTTPPISTGTAAGTADPSPLFEVFRQSAHPAVYGAYKALSVAYQSCGALRLPALSTSTPAVQGVAIGDWFDDTHVGHVRTITSRAKVYSTNPYYVNQSSPGGACFTETNDPLIYAYGGKPYVSSSSSTEINFFRNGNTGAPTLGIDCSAFVSSSILVGGLRLKKGTSSKAFQTLGVNSTMFSRPEANGLSCLKTLTVSATDTLRPGDVLAYSGHVVMIDSVSSDPWGIASAKSIADCTAEKVNSTHFNFTLVQSASVLSGIGMNRFSGSSYMTQTAPMRTAMNAYALAFCKAKFGSVATPTSLTATLVRHLGTAECQEATRITLKDESCMKSCGVPASIASIEDLVPGAL